MDFRGVQSRESRKKLNCNDHKKILERLVEEIIVDTNKVQTQATYH